MPHWAQAACLGRAEIEPGDENAAKYLAAIRQRVPQALLSPPARSPATPASRLFAAAKLQPAQQRDGGAASRRQAPAMGTSGVRQQPAAANGQGGATPAVEPRASPSYSPGKPSGLSSAASRPACIVFERWTSSDHMVDLHAVADRQGSPSSGGSGGARPQPGMDMRRALALVSDHYSRNAIFPCTPILSVQLLVVSVQMSGRPICQRSGRTCGGGKPICTP